MTTPLIEVKYKANSEVIVEQSQNREDDLSSEEYNPSDNDDD